MSANKKYKFQSKLESISSELEYYAVSVPAKITAQLGTKAAVPISAQVNDSPIFRGSLYPLGNGRHNMRIKAEIRKAVNIKEGDRVQVEFTVVNREVEASDLPKDVLKALKEEGVLNAFKSLPPGKRGFMLQLIEQAAKPETRVKRIQDAVDAGHAKKEK